MIVALLTVLGIYLACGLLFAVPFIIVGVKGIDPAAAHGSWGFQLLIIPGTVVFWPLLLRRWQTGIATPPAEKTAHRRAAHKGVAP